MDGIGNGVLLVYIDDEFFNQFVIFDNVEIKIIEEDYQCVNELFKNLSIVIDLENYVDVDEVLRYFVVYMVVGRKYIGVIGWRYFFYDSYRGLLVLGWKIRKIIVK